VYSLVFEALWLTFQSANRAQHIFFDKGRIASAQDTKRRANRIIDRTVDEVIVLVVVSVYGSGGGGGGFF
jgi:hypothetical protein